MPASQGPGSIPTLNLWLAVFILPEQVAPSLTSYETIPYFRGSGRLWQRLVHFLQHDGAAR